MNIFFDYILKIYLSFIFIAYNLFLIHSFDINIYLLITLMLHDNVLTLFVLRILGLFILLRFYLYQGFIHSDFLLDLKLEFYLLDLILLFLINYGFEIFEVIFDL